MSTTALTLDLLRRSGYLAEVVERWIPKVNRRRDLFGVGDVLAIHAHRKPSTLLVQCTSTAHVGDRLKKARSKPALRTWLASSDRAFEVHGWTQRGGRWEVKRVSVKAGDMTEVIEQPSRRTKRRAERELFEE